MQIETTKFNMIVRDEPKIFAKYVPPEPELICLKCAKQYAKHEKGHEKYNICQNCAHLISKVTYYNWK